MTPAVVRIGSLFSGYGGLDMGVAAALDGPTHLAWVCEIDPAPARILTHHHPDVPNLGDITAVRWDTVEPVDILTGGFVEWLMGLPGGHVTAPEIGLTRNEQLKALGNGVVPQQAEAAVRWLLNVRTAALQEVAA